MNDFKSLIALIEKAIENFNSKVPAIQQKMLDSIRFELRTLDVKNGKISATVKNVRKIAEIKNKLQSLILSKEYLKNVKEFVAKFDQITALQNQYFETQVGKFTIPAIVKEIRKQAIESLIDKLTESGIQTNITNGIEDILRKNITTGGSYSELDTILENNIIENGTGEGNLQRYTKQITTDSINQYSAQYTQIVSSDLGFEWYRYSGSNIQTTRPWCLACTKKLYIHISEFPALIRGDFPEFEEFDGKLYKGLPAGMYPDTNVSNLTIYRGGYNCGHQLRPVTESLVPETYKTKVYATPAYKAWKAAA